MSNLNLKFDTPLNTAHPVDLRFGAPLVAPLDSNLTMSAHFAPPTLTAFIQKIRVLSLASGFPAPSLSGVLKYDNSVARGIHAATSNAWQETSQIQQATASLIPAPLNLRTRVSPAWQKSLPLKSSVTLMMQAANHNSKAASTSWQDGIPTNVSASTQFADKLHIPRPSLSTIWTASDPVTGASITKWRDLYRSQLPPIATHWIQASPLSMVRTALAGSGLALLPRHQSHWQEARLPSAGRYDPVVPPVIKPACYTPPLGLQVHLIFNTAWTPSTDLLFSCLHKLLPAAKIVPVRRSYIVMNDVHLKRVEGNHDLNATSLSLNIDMDSWTWGFSASLPASSLSLVKPGMSGDPVLLAASINGTNYLLLAEGIQRTRSFGKSSITVTGRGPSAALADPYSPLLSFANTADRTAQQLMNDALTINGVPLGWAIDWRIDDWLVPAGAWSHRGSYMSAVTAIATAAGAFVQPDPVNKILRVRPRYPAKPWEWNAITPDLQLPSAVVVNESISWVDKPAYNAVYVSGATAGGVLGYVKRTGSAGDLVAPMVTDALITDAIAARQRGTAILSDTGKMALYSLSLPVLPETGIIVPGTMVRYVDDGPIIGVIKGVSANASTTSVRQTIEVQTHG